MRDAMVKALRNYIHDLKSQAGAASIHVRKSESTTHNTGRIDALNDVLIWINENEVTFHVCEFVRDNTIMLTSYPPQFLYKCECGKAETRFD